MEGLYKVKVKVVPQCFKTEEEAYAAGINDGFNEGELSGLAKGRQSIIDETIDLMEEKVKEGVLIGRHFKKTDDMSNFAVGILAGGIVSTIIFSFFL